MFGCSFCVLSGQTSKANRLMCLEAIASKRRLHVLNTIASLLRLKVGAEDWGALEL